MNTQTDTADATSNPQTLAERAAAAMYEQDHATRMLGMAVDTVAPGYARLSMVVREDMVNGHAICHGGLIFTLADSAFAFACNSYNQLTLAAGCDIEFLRPACAGETLTAEAIERNRKGRSGVYDVSVHNNKDELIALFRGKCRQLGGQIVEE